MANHYSKCMFCEVRHSPRNCVYLNESYEEIEPELKARRYERRSDPLAKESNSIGDTAEDFYTLLGLGVWTITSLVVAVLLISVWF